MNSIRKKSTRTQTPDDTVESFSPIDEDANFDEIEPEPEPVSVSVLEPVPERQPEESTLHPLLLARELRGEPSIPAIECPTGDILDPNQECFRELRALRDQVRWFLTPAPSRTQFMSLVRKGTRLRPG
jgi:hypothetical protein